MKIITDSSYPIGVRKLILEILLKKKYESDEEFQQIITDQVEMNKIQNELKFIKKTEYFGRIIWTFFHVMSSKIKGDYFDSFKDEYLDMCKKICKNLPCSICKMHASIVMDNIDFQLIKTKSDLESFFCDFHNSVNQGTQKQVFSEEKLSKYSEINTKNMVTVLKLLIKKLFKKEIYDSFSSWISNNMDKFNE